MAEITWIKLKTDMFDNDKIKLIEALPDKDAIIVIWVKLLAAAGKANCNGYIMLTENIAMNIEEMATIFNRPLNTVRLAIDTFRRYGMIEMDEGDAIRIKNWDVHQNIEGMDRVKQLNAERNRKYRERKKQQALEAPKEPENTKNDVSVTSRMTLSDDTETDLDLDKDLDIDKDKQQTVGQSNDVQKLNNFFTKRLNRFPSEQLREDINFYLETYNDADLIIEAFNRSLADGRVKAKEKYALGTLRNWKHEGTLSYELLMKKEAQQLAGNQLSTTKGQRTTQSELGVDVGF
ncbi:phage replisome organizer N-terminal domain-containing protein [Lysinibacillus fusiformis]|uniref:phage replisome organizer N-terminal domain-containing protein n=1 Tax=Lysinibacillus fusiformis TaxID=28031 RepID=UPI0018804253|nr:phage replisome organizer N-terminal domain-containing protein [Lysinibacillus fusiformis]MBD8521833.1 phage replisome organizer N-terminal domain-containing protein [Lysinibacillus fusiformis]